MPQLFFLVFSLILRKENGEFVETITTNEKGIAVSGLLPDGKYIAKEKVAKDGYKLNEKEYPFEIDAAKEKLIKKNTSTLNIPNKRKTIDFEATKVWKMEFLLIIKKSN